MSKHTVKLNLGKNINHIGNRDQVTRNYHAEFTHFYKRGQEDKGKGTRAYITIILIPL